MNWGKAIIMPLYKNGQINNVENYRGISLLPSVSKVFASIIFQANWAEQQ